MSPSRTVRHEAGSYEIEVASGAGRRLGSWILEHLRPPTVAVIADERVARHHLESLKTALEAVGLEVVASTVPEGERAKSRSEWARLCDWLVDAGVGRDGLIVALGGGVTSDLAGFVAATHLRGVRWVAVPTSLLAMVDASIGGKTGVDTPLGKNLVGAFHPPRKVVADPDYLGTLPEPAFREGLAEMIKHAAILDRNAFEAIEALAAGKGSETSRAEAIFHSADLKAGVVEQDELEGGLREILNFGHTVGHAVEALSDYGLTHGEAVAVGMVAEARAGEEAGISERGTAASLRRRIEGVGLPGTVEVLPRLDSFQEMCRRDKKVRSGEVRCVFLSRVGEVARRREGGWSHPVAPKDLHRALELEHGL